MSKTALRYALYAWAAMMAVFLGSRAVPGKVPAWELPTSSGSTASLRDLEGKPFGVLLYASKVTCGAHTRAVADAVQIRAQLKDHPRYAVKIVYGERTEAGARALAEGHKDVPILLDPAKRLADELRDHELRGRGLQAQRPDRRAAQGQGPRRAARSDAVPGPPDPVAPQASP
ncbi:MAG: hypothetical protein QM765_06255 [Myxococcales bacterium]